MATPTNSTHAARIDPIATEVAMARVLRDAPTGAVHHLLKRPVARPAPSPLTAPALSKPRSETDRQAPAMTRTLGATSAAGGGAAPVQAVLDAYAASAAPAPLAPLAVDALATGAQAGYDEGYERGHAEGLRAGADASREQIEQAHRALEARAEEGLNDARQELRATFEGAVARVQALASSLNDEVAGRLEAAEEDMLVLCHEVVARILGDAAVRPDVLRTLLQHASRELRGRPLVAVHLHPDDLELLTQGTSGDARDQLLDGSQAARTVEWVASPDVALGGMILHSPEGGLDARLETQLDTLRHTLLQNRAARKARRVAASDAGVAAAHIPAEGARR